MPQPRRRKSVAATEPERLLQAKLPARLVKALRILALEQDTTVKELLTRLVDEYVAQQRRSSGGRG
jgi:glutamine synthetase